MKKKCQKCCAQKDDNTNGSEALIQFDQTYYKLSCPIKNRFALLAPLVEGQESTDHSTIKSNPQG